MRKIGVLASMVMAAAVGSFALAAAPSAADHAKAAIRQYRSGAALWRPAPTKHKHRRSGERAHRRWRRRRATGRHRK